MLSTKPAFCLLSLTGCRRGRPRMGEQVGDDMAADVKVDEKNIARNTNYKVFKAEKIQDDQRDGCSAPFVLFCRMVTEQSVYSIDKEQNEDKSFTDRQSGTCAIADFCEEWISIEEWLDVVSTNEMWCWCCQVDEVQARRST